MIKVWYNMGVPRKGGLIVKGYFQQSMDAKMHSTFFISEKNGMGVVLVVCEDGHTDFYGTENGVNSMFSILKELGATCPAKAMTLGEITKSVWKGVS